MELLVAAALAVLAGANEREVSFEGAGGLELVGTLALPAEIPAGGAPALVLLPGSGPTDRNGNQPPLLVTDLLKQVAERLAHEGYATLRFDKRSSRRYALKILSLSVEEQNEFLSFASFVGDAQAALKFLREEEEVDAERIGLLGHSEGGLIALKIAYDGADLSALVLAGTAGSPLADVIRYQIGRVVEPYPEEDQKELLGHLDRVMAHVVKTGAVPDDVPKGLAGLFPANAAKLLQVELALDPARLAKRYRGPVLVLNGEFDVQVRAAKHTKLLADAFGERKTGSCEVVVVPGASHNFKQVASEREPGFDGAVVLEALERLVAWLDGAL